MGAALPGLPGLAPPTELLADPGGTPTTPPTTRSAHPTALT